MAGLTHTTAPTAADAAKRELSIFDAGIGSLGELTELPRMLSLQSLNLHCNRVQQMSNLESLTQLRSLNLSSNLIEVMGGMHTLTQLQTLDLSCNRIRLIDGLATLRNLRRLLLSFNRISSLAGLVQCHGSALEHFEAYGNRVALLREAEYLRGLPGLTEVVLRRHGQDNPMCREAAYRERLVLLLPTLQRLDDASTPAGELALEKARQPALPLSAVLSECGVSAIGDAQHDKADAGGSGGLGLTAKIDSVSSMASAAAAAGRGGDGTKPPGGSAAASSVAPSHTPHIDKTFEALRARRQSEANSAVSAPARLAERGECEAAPVGGAAGGAAPNPLLQSLQTEIRLERLETTLGLHAVQSAVQRAVDKGRGGGEEGGGDEAADASASVARRGSAAMSTLHPEGAGPTAAGAPAASSIVIPDLSDGWPTGGGGGRRDRRETFPEPPPHRGGRGDDRYIDGYDDEAGELGRAVTAAADSAAYATAEMSPQEWEAEYDAEYDADERDLEEALADAYGDLGDSISARGGAVGRGSAARAPPHRARQAMQHAPPSSLGHSSDADSLTAASLAEHERSSVRKEINRLREKLKQTEIDVAKLVEAAAASEQARAAAVANGDMLTQRLAHTERQLASVQTELGASASASGALVAERDAARADCQRESAAAAEANVKIARLETENSACKRELDRSAHAVTLAAQRETQAREALAELGDLSSRRLHEAGAAASEDAAKHAALQQEMASLRGEMSNATSTIAALESAVGHAQEQEAAKAAELAKLREQAAAQAVSLRAEHAQSLEAMRTSLERGYAAREEEMQARLEAAEGRATEARQRETRLALQEETETANSLASLRKQLLAAVAKEVSARGAAQEMAGLLREQQSKLSSLAESRRELQAEVAAVKARAAEEVREAQEEAKAAVVEKQAAAAAVQAATTREQLALAQATEEKETFDRRIALELAAKDKEHSDAMRLKQVMLDDFSAQVTTARQAAQRAQDAAMEAVGARDSALHDAASNREAHEALRASEETIARLESDLEDLEYGRQEARTEAQAARNECRHKEEMLEFVEKEVCP